MQNTPQNSNQKNQQNSNTSGNDKNSDRNSTQQKDGGMKNDPKSSDPRREREEEDRPRAGNK